MGYYNIVAPRNKEGMRELDYGEISDENAVQIYLNDEQFKILWNSNVLSDINILADVNIDFAEDESIIDLTKVEKVLNSGLFEIMFKNEELNKIVADIKGVFLAALQHKTGVFFFF
jgi:hypothetical protein